MSNGMCQYTRAILRHVTKDRPRDTATFTCAICTYIHTVHVCVYLGLFTPESSAGEMSGNVQLVLRQSGLDALLWSTQELRRVDILVQWLYINTYAGTII